MSKGKAPRRNTNPNNQQSNISTFQNPPHRPPSRITAVKDANLTPMLEQFRPPIDVENVLRWLPTNTEFVRYFFPGRYGDGRPAEIKLDIGRVDFRLIREPDGQHYYDVGYQTLQTGDMMCQTIDPWGRPMPLSSITLSLYHASGRLLTTFSVKFMVYGGAQKEVPPEPQPAQLISDTPTPEAILRETVRITAEFPPSFLIYGYAGPRFVSIED